ncbi:MAG TPA: WD40 repeat domain-containing protein [Thermoflexus sp.]|uniref:hypothetical protein n=1 Tax=Thermoflexus sp. TaxID=1969742 RepID=UPI002CE5D0D0|nr:WD40 repeat domain-containing protein [Thermoflexus sp.]
MKQQLVFVASLIVIVLTRCTLFSPPEGKGTPPPPLQEAAGGTPTPVPTLEAEPAWLEPQARLALIFKRPSPLGGQDLYRLSPDGRPPVRLLNLQDELFRASASPDGKFLAIHTRPREGAKRDKLFLLSLSDLSLDLVTQDTWITTMAWAPSGSALTFSQWTDGSVQIVSYDLTAHRLRTLFEWRGSGPWDIVGWVLDDGKLLLSHLAGGGLLIDQLDLLDVQTAEVKTVYTDSTKLTSIVSVAPGGRVALVGQLRSTTDPRVRLQRLDLTNNRLTPLMEPEDANALVASVPVWSPTGKRVAFTVSSSFGKGAQGVDRIVILDVESGEVSTVVEFANPSPLAFPLAWLSEEVLLVSNLSEESTEVLYSIRTDGTGMQRILDLSGGRWLTVSP